MRIASFFAYLGAIALIIFSLGSLNELIYFYDIPSVLIFLGGIVICLVNFKFSEIFNAFKDATYGNNNIDFQKRFELDKEIIKTIPRYIISFAIMGAMIGVIFILGNLSDTSKLGPSIALAILPLIYAVFSKIFLFTPLEVSLEKKMIQIKTNIHLSNQ